MKPEKIKQAVLCTLFFLLPFLFAAVLYLALFFSLTSRPS